MNKVKFAELILLPPPLPQQNTTERFKVIKYVFNCQVKNTAHTNYQDSTSRKELCPH